MHTFLLGLSLELLLLEYSLTINTRKLCCRKKRLDITKHNLQFLYVTNYINWDFKLVVKLLSVGHSLVQQTSNLQLSLKSLIFKLVTSCCKGRLFHYCTFERSNLMSHDCELWNNFFSDHVQKLLTSFRVRFAIYICYTGPGCSKPWLN